MNNNFSVFVNDVQVNDKALFENEAADLALKYTAAGYTNVFVTDNSTVENNGES